MTVFNAGNRKHRQYLYCLYEDEKPDTAYIGDRLYVIHAKKAFIFDGEDWVEYYDFIVKIDINYDEPEEEENGEGEVLE